jgi:hypothetical protein
VGIDRRDPGVRVGDQSAVLLIVKGFKPTAITSGATNRVGLGPVPAHRGESAARANWALGMTWVSASP